MNQKRQIAALLVLLVIAGIVWHFHSADPAVIEDTAAFAQNYPPLAVDNPQLHWWKLEDSRKAEYKSTGRNIFNPAAPVALVKREQKPPDQDAAAPPTQPVAPPLVLPVKFFGYGTAPVGAARRAFFTDGDDIWIVGEGETLMGRYRVLKIGNANLEFEEISTGRRANALLEEQGPGV